MNVLTAAWASAEKLQPPGKPGYEPAGHRAHRLADEVGVREGRLRRRHADNPGHQPMPADCFNPGRTMRMARQYIAISQLGVMPATLGLTAAR
jgi:hypothetical protein